MLPAESTESLDSSNPLQAATISFNPQRYIRTIQLPYCCVPASLHTILLRRGLEPITQEDIGRDLGLVVPESAAKHFSAVSTGEPGPAGYGTRIDLPEYSLPVFLKKHNLPLEFTYLPPKKIDDIESILKDLIKQDADIIVCFDVGELYNRPEYLGMGHVSVVDSVDGTTVSLVESARTREPLQRVRTEDLIRAIVIHGESKMGGLWVIKSL